MCKIMKTYVLGLDEEEKPNEIIMVLRADPKLEGHIDELMGMLEESLPMVSFNKVNDVKCNG